MRLDRFLSNSGKGSRKEIKELLKSGVVSVNGTAVKKADIHIDEKSDTICIGNVPIIYKPFIYLMLNKPSGYVSAVYDKHLPVVTELVDEKYSHYDVFPVGRLDIDTEGLLLLTNDGDLCHRLLSPKSHVDKTYFVRNKKPLTENDIKTFKDGVTLDDGYKTMSASLSILQDSCEALLTIQEGKFHQVKRMMQAVGNEVVYLKRVSMGTLELDEKLPLGKIRELTDEEIAHLCQKTNKSTKY